MVDNRISGRLALITGASGGIGAACARDLYAQGVHLALTYSTNRASIEALVASLSGEQSPPPPLSSLTEATKTGATEEAGSLTNGKENGRENGHEHPATKPTPPPEKLRVSIHKADLGSVEEIANLFEEVKREHGGAGVDILVSNAGYGKRIVDVSDISLEEFEYTLNINLRASFLLVKGVVEGMKAKQWGRIVFISSIAAYGAGINGCHYAASKGGLTGMMRNLASRLAKYNISVNDVAPAMIGNTGMIPNPKAVPGVVETIPLGRSGEPNEVANAVTMFCRTGYATGQSLVVGGGLR